MIKNRFFYQRYIAYAYSLFFRRLFLKAISANQFLPPSTRASALRSLRKSRVHGSKLRNFCHVSLRFRAFYRHFLLARSKVHELAGFGLLPGVKRSGW
jgi:ribosomal protein S14